MIAVALGLLSPLLPVSGVAQGITTVAIGGLVSSVDGSLADGARVKIINALTGVSSNARTRNGRFLVQGLEVGGPYIVTVLQLGFTPYRSAPLSVALGERRDIAVQLRPAEVVLHTIVTSAVRTPGGGGTATLIPESLVSRLPTPNRNFYDFARLAPQISTKIGNQRAGISAAGANHRFNNFLINGADERFVNSNLSSALGTGRSISLDAVKEFQVLIAPYDVRYGDFAGALVNAVTKSGTNDIHGSVFSNWRNDRMARGGDLATTSRYDRRQVGFSIGGPLLRDRLHFFIAPEIQRLTTPAPGPYVGQPVGSTPPVPVAAGDLRRLDEVMAAYGLSTGSAQLVELHTPLQNIFARMDLAVPRWNSRALIFLNRVGSDDDRFSRAAPDTFSLSSYKTSTVARVTNVSLQAHTDFPQAAGLHNEFVFSILSDRLNVIPDVKQPIIRVLVPNATGGTVLLNTGTLDQAQGTSDRSHSTTLRDEITFSLGSSHALTLGVQQQRFEVNRASATGSYGYWNFSSLDSLARGLASRYEVRKNLRTGNTSFPGAQIAAYANDEWQLTHGLLVTLGLRFDRMGLERRAPYNALVDSIFHRRTDQMPRERLELSPRLGFVWQINKADHQTIRGGIGMFSGRPPLAWLRAAVTDFGVGTGILLCGARTSDAGPPPIFNPDYLTAPTACATGAPIQTAPLGDVSLLDPNLRIARSLRYSLAYDHHFSESLTSTTELVFTRGFSDFVFVNLNLQGPQSVDRVGRVLYGTITANGVSTPTAPRSRFAGVVDLVNTSKNSSYQSSTRFEKRLSSSIAANASYTFSHTRDVQSPSRVNLAGRQLWAEARVMSGRHETLNPGVSANDLPHRVVGGFTYLAPWKKYSTSVAAYYVAESGSPFTYVAWGTNGRGDLNADGSNTNDPIYVPLATDDIAQIVFSGRSDLPGADNSLAGQATRVSEQQLAFQALIDRTPCMRQQRGHILERNTCREPWSHTSVASVRQAIDIGGRTPELTIDIFNVLNLLNGSWGRYRVAAPRLLEHVGRTPDAESMSQPIFRFDTTRPEWTTLRTESAFNIQIGLHYNF